MAVAGLARSVPVSQSEGVTDRDARRVPPRRSRLVWGGASLMVVGISLLALVLIGGLRSSNDSTRPSPVPTTSEDQESPTPSSPKGATEGSPPAASPPSAPGDEGSDSSSPPSAPSAATVTVTETQTLLSGSGGGTTAGESKIDVPGILTALAGLITAGVGAASFFAGRRRHRPPAGDAAAR